MSGPDPFAVTHSVQVADRLGLVIEFAGTGDADEAPPPRPLPAASLVAEPTDTAEHGPPVSIIDFLGNPVEVTHHARDDNVLVINAIAPLADPATDAPSYKVTIGSHSTWFAPASRKPIAENEAPSRLPSGSTGIDYLARDYTAFTAMMRSRISEIVEQDSAWALDHPADPMTTIVEALAYAADHLSFRQDAAGTESYLPTARHRLSLRRHARLRDYLVDDGCSPRTALAFQVNNYGVIDAGQAVVTQQPGQLDLILPSDVVLAPSSAVFETMEPLDVSPIRNNLGYALTQSKAFTLPKGTISLNLNYPYPELAPGQLIILEQTSAPAGAATPFGAQTLRLLQITPIIANAMVIGTTITWHPEDALERDLVVPPSKATGTVSLYGNVVLADHGRTIAVTPNPGTVPPEGEYRPVVVVSDPVLACPPPEIDPGFDGTQDLVAASLMVTSARASLNPDPRDAALAITLTGFRPGMAGVTDSWTAAPDLLATAPTGRCFAASPEAGAGGDPRYLELRFGDGAFGERPPAGTNFANPDASSTARTGGNQNGRVRANSLVQLIGPAPLVSGISNPLPTVPVPAEESQSIRLLAANGFRTNLRGIEPSDWERLAERDPLIVSVHADYGPDGYAPCVVGITTRPTTPEDVSYDVASARLMDYAVLGAPPVLTKGADAALDIALVVYAVPDADLTALRNRLQRRIGSGTLADGTPAYFNPLRWPLGRSVMLSGLVAAVQAEPGVRLVVTDSGVDPRVHFELFGTGDTDANLLAGRIAIAADQCARIANDPTQPELGTSSVFVVASP